MVWPAGQEGTRNNPNNPVADLVSQLESGSATAEGRLAALFRSGHASSYSFDELDGLILDALAASAAAGSPYSLELLLGLVTEHRLAAPAIHRHVQDPAMIEEIEQEVLIAVARSIHRYRGDAKFTTWLFALARNSAISEIRRHKPTSTIDEDDVDTWSQRGVSSLVAERDMIREAVLSLPPAFRDTVLLRDVERLSYSEIAERQGLTINTVRSRLSRGRALLAANLPGQPAG